MSVQHRLVWEKLYAHTSGPVFQNKPPLLTYFVQGQSLHLTFLWTDPVGTNDGRSEPSVGQTPASDLICTNDLKGETILG